MKIVTIPISEITPHKGNAKIHTPEQVDQIIASMERFGNCDPIGVWGDKNIIVEGHGRYMALKKIGKESALCVRLDHLTDEERRAYMLAHNQTTMNTGWETDLLTLELGGITDIDMGLFGFESHDIAAGYDQQSSGALKAKYIMPPFSVLDARQGDWQKRKKEWLKIIDSGAGREEALIGKGFQQLAQKASPNTTLTGTSIFDPVLCEIMLNWYSPRGGKILDPFAGGSVRGIVSSFLGRDYHGNDLRLEQITENYAGYEKIKNITDFYGDALRQPRWTVGDSRNIDDIVADNDFDMLLTCPPYFDLEQYSDNPKDISNMPYDEFMAVYSDVFKKSIAKLRDNAFAVVVVGEIRDKKGYYRNFIGDTIGAMESAGAKYYNEIILITMGGTLALRAGLQFEATRKVANTHQKALVFFKSNGDAAALKEYMDEFERTKIITPMHRSILVFLKGNPKLANEDLGTYDYELF